MGYWIRITETWPYQETQIKLDSHCIDNGWGLLRLPSVPKIKISIDKNLFQQYFAFHHSSERSQFLNIAFQLDEDEIFVQRPFSVTLECASNMHDTILDKTMIYRRLRYLELKLFCQSPNQINITLQSEDTLSHLIVKYMSRALVFSEMSQMDIPMNATLLDGMEVCWKTGTPCYTYHRSPKLTWNEAQTWCQRQRSNLISINSPWNGMKYCGGHMEYICLMEFLSWTIYIWK